MKSGIIYSSAAAIDGIIDRLQDELEGEATVIATGGLAKKIVPHCKREIILDDDLVLKGLAVIYRKNRKVQKSREEKRKIMRNPLRWKFHEAAGFFGRFIM